MDERGVLVVNLDEHKVVECEADESVHVLDLPLQRPVIAHGAPDEDGKRHDRLQDACEDDEDMGGDALDEREGEAQLERAEPGGNSEHGGVACRAADRHERGHVNGPLGEVIAHAQAHDGRGDEQRERELKHVVVNHFVGW